MNKLNFLIAFRYLRSKRKEGFISIISLFSFIGIMIGVATLIIVMSVMNGFHHELVNRILGINSHIAINSSSISGITNYKRLIEEIEKIDNVKYVNPMVESQVMFNAKRKSSAGLARGINSKDLKAKNLIKENLIAGRFFYDNAKNEIVIGSALAESMNLSINDKIKIISATTNNTILGTVPRIKTYKIVGIFESGLYEYDVNMIFMPLKLAQIHFRFKEAASSIEIFSKNINELEQIKFDIYELISLSPDLYVNDWRDVNRSFIDALKIERTAMFLILTLIIFVAAFNIISSLIMLVNDKKKDISCLRTMGIYKSDIVKIFLIAGSVIGFSGTLFGLIIGIAFSSNINSIKSWLENLTNSSLFDPTIYFLSNLPSKIFLSDILLVTIMSLTISLLATIYPAYKASKTNPAEILK